MCVCVCVFACVCLHVCVCMCCMHIYVFMCDNVNVRDMVHTIAYSLNCAPFRSLMATVSGGFPLLVCLAMYLLAGAVATSTESVPLYTWP